MASEFEKVIKQITEEKGITAEDVISSIEAALASAYRKDFGEKGQNIVAEFDPEGGKTRIFDVKEVAEIDEELGELEKPQRQITLEEAKKMDEKYEIGDEIRTELTPEDEMEFGRIAAQTAKQVITQRLREAERNVVFNTFKDKEDTVVTGTVQRIEGRTVFVDMGSATGVLFPSEQIRDEHYSIGQRLKLYVMSVTTGPKGPEIHVSRSHEEIVRKLFEFEVPEIGSGAVEIKSIAREAGSRSKIAVHATEDDIDPVGACVGQRGSRVQTIIAELSGEKIDIIEWDPDAVKFITNALSPAKIISVKIDEENKHAIVEVMEDQLSLAIGKSGQNVRLAVKLTGWTIDVVKAGIELGVDSSDESEEEKNEASDESSDEEFKEIDTANADNSSEEEAEEAEADESSTEDESDESVEEKAEVADEEEKK